jgi:hypothetical protein
MIDLFVQLGERTVETSVVDLIKVFTLCNVNSFFQFGEVVILVGVGIQPIACFWHIDSTALPKKKREWIDFIGYKHVKLLFCLCPQCTTARAKFLSTST